MAWTAAALGDPAEPSAGSLDRANGDQTRWVVGGTDDREDEYDGAEPDEWGNRPQAPSIGKPTREVLAFRRLDH